MKLKTNSKAKNILPDGNGNRSKHYVNGVSLFRYCREHGFDKAEYARCLWLIKNKCMSAEEALQYHRPPANENKEWIRKVNQRRRYGIKKEYLELKDKYLIEMGYDKQSKYFYKGMRLKKYCEKHKISYGMVQKRIKKLGMKINDAIKFTKKQVMEWLKNRPSEKKKVDYSPKPHKRRVINIETLEIFPSISDCARKYCVSSVSIYSSITHSVGRKRWRTKQQLFEFYDEWVLWDKKEKENYTRKNNIYFY